MKMFSDTHTQTHKHSDNLGFLDVRQAWIWGQEEHSINHKLYVLVEQNTFTSSNFFNFYFLVGILINWSFM